MFAVEMKKKLLTKDSTFRLREKQEERGTRKTLCTIDYLIFNLILIIYKKEEK
jgi:hypothetical protein